MAFTLHYNLPPTSLMSATSPPPSSTLSSKVQRFGECDAGVASLTLRKPGKIIFVKKLPISANFIIYIGPNNASWGHKNKYTDITCVTLQPNKNSHCTQISPVSQRILTKTVTVHRHHRVTVQPNKKQSLCQSNKNTVTVSVKQKLPKRWR